MFDFAAAPATYLLLAVNVAVSLYVFASPHLVEKLSLKPYDVVQNRAYERLLTAGFVHGSLMHLLFNMIALWSFGVALESQVFGPGRFLLLYFGSEMAANALSVFLHRRNARYAAIGASGAVSGVVLSFVLFAPMGTVGVFFIPMPAWLFAIVYIAGSIYAMRSENRHLGGIAHEAHLGGALGGILLTIILEPAAISIFFNQIGL